ncbi:MAG: mannose-1-phosphate guanylyltransferase [Bacteroidales bacterium]|nr:mannose-1-phosphate guanylyltransferase [Candidatus Cryptobacteroides aphodequi]
MSVNHNYCVIMAGGLGTRFWPISRKARPKQFLDLSHSGKSFLRSTYERMLGVVPAENIIVVTLKEYCDMVREQIPELPEENLLQELYNRNTLVCITYAAMVIRRRDPEAVMIATPADHLITGVELYHETLRKALAYAAGSDSLITLGIVPTRPDANFGYIQVSGGKKAIEAGEPVAVKTFTEKPDKEIARVFVDSGEFLWNSGIFVWKVSAILEEIRKYAPMQYSLWQETDDIDRIYTDSTRISIDYAVMEKTERAVVVPCRFGWADIGNWESLYSYVGKPDENGNVTNVKGKYLFRDDRGNIIYSSNEHKLMAVQGLENMLVINTKDVLMICPRDEKKLKDYLAELAMPEFEEYR